MPRASSARACIGQAAKRTGNSRTGASDRVEGKCGHRLAAATVAEDCRADMAKKSAGCFACFWSGGAKRCYKNSCTKEKSYQKRAYAKRKRRASRARSQRVSFFSKVS